MISTCGKRVHVNNKEIVEGEPQQVRKLQISLKVGCPQVIKFKGLVRDKSHFWFQKVDKFQINSVRYVYTFETSFPCYLKFIDRVGLHTQTITTNENFQLCTMLDDDPCNPTSAIHIFLERLSPHKSKHCTSPKICAVITSNNVVVV